jgi:hypothetical protein
MTKMPPLITLEISGVVDMPVEDDPDVFVVVIDGAQAENKVHARALLIRVP